MRIFQEISKAKEQNIPFVAFRHPNDNQLHFIRQNNDDLNVFQNFSSEGYVFAPFDDSEDAYLLNSDFTITEDYTTTTNDVKLISDIPINDISKQRHIDLVEMAVDAIKKTNLSKIVISRSEEVLLKSFNVVDVFNKLLSNYSSAYVYVWFHPKVGLWLGATPETLLKVNGGMFKTMALAGTQTFEGDLNPKWGEKELLEQQMVTDFIKSNLVNRVEDLEFSKTETVKAGSLLHLKTEVKGRITNEKDLGALVSILHPTPAVCGLPKQDSKQFILENENYKRSFYTGYLGEIGKRKTALYVNLRCFNVKDNKAYLYIGGGITKDSIAKNEWKETVAKSLTIKKVLV